jgi:hypothetical protein
MELGLGSAPVANWSWPKFNIHFEPFKGYSRYLRYPDADQGMDYRIKRIAVIFVLGIKHALRYDGRNG